MPLPAPDFERLFAPGTHHILPGGHALTIRLRTAGWLSLPSGRVVAGEPFMYGGMEESGGFVQRVPPGRYPVVLILGDFGDEPDDETYAHTTVAAARLVIRDEPVVSWEMAVYDGQDVGLLGDDEFYGYPVDGGTGGFVDAQNVPALCADHDGYMDRLMGALYERDDDPTAPVTLTGAESEPVVVAFPSGDGDGHYPTWIGRTADGEVACVLTDFFLLPEEGDDEPELRLDPAGFAQGNEMRVGQTLRRQSLTSSSGRYTLVHQDDGNLVLYHNAQLRSLWASGTDGTRAPICMLREDAGLVLLGDDGRRIWSSGGPAARLVVRDDGDVAVEDPAGTVVWSTGTAEASVPEGPVAIGDRMLPGQTLGRQSLTSPSGRTTLVHQDDGNLVLYDNDGRDAVWSSGTQGRGTARCVLHSGGDLVLYDREGRVVWSTDTAGHPGSVLTVEDDDLTLRAPDGAVLWRVTTALGAEPPSPTSSSAMAPTLARPLTSPLLTTAATPGRPLTPARPATAATPMIPAAPASGMVPAKPGVPAAPAKPVVESGGAEG